MDYRVLSALLSSLISQILLLIVLIFPSLDVLSVPLFSNPNPLQTLLPEIIHSLSASHVAASLVLVSSRPRKRKRDLSPETDSGNGDPAVRTSPDEFKVCFKMTRSTFEWLASLLEPLLECRDPVGSPLNLAAETRLGIGLFRLATGSDHSEISTRFGVSEPVARFCVKQLCRVLCTNFRFWVGFPGQGELESVSDSFEALTGLPNCCGVIDLTRFKIVSSSGSDLQEETLAAQLVVDSSSRILSVAAGFHGEIGEVRVLKLSTLYHDIERKNLLNAPPIDINGVSIPQYLVGDEDYPLLPWLVVPFANPAAESNESIFNSAVDLIRVPAEKTMASLKSWGVLSRPIKAEFKTAVAYIGACSILHNALLMREDYSAFVNELDDSSAYDEKSPHRKDIRLEESLVENRAAEIRRALATRTRILC